MVKVVRVPVENEIRRLEDHLAAMERKYRMTTEEMAAAAWKDHSLDTPEVGLWLTNYQALKMIRRHLDEDKSGLTTGSRSKTT
jgi:hypothetical protein